MSTDSTTDGITSLIYTNLKIVTVQCPQIYFETLSLLQSQIILTKKSLGVSLLMLPLESISKSYCLSLLIFHKLS